MSDPCDTQDSPPINPTGTPTPPYNKTPIAEALDAQQYLRDLSNLFDDIYYLLKQETYQTFKPLIDGGHNLADDLNQRCNAAFERLIEFAVYLNENQYIYGFFGAPDGFVLGYSMLRYPFDLLHSASKADAVKALRHWLDSPEGFTFALAWLASLTICSAYANGMSKQKDPDSKERYVYWQAIRDGMKGLRNIHRGLRSLFEVIQHLGFMDARYLLLPLGLLLGIPSMHNRWWSRHMVATRKKTMDANNALSEELLNWGRFDDTLTLLPPDKDELKTNYANSYLLTNKADEKNRNLYYINHEGKSENLGLDQDEINTFLGEREELIFYKYPAKPEKNQTHPTVLQWHTLLPTKAEQHLKTFTEHIEKKLKVNTTIPNQDHKNRAACERSAGYGGFVDGLYLFMPLAAVIPLSSGAFAVVALLSTACVFAFIFTRMQEEEEFDKLLHVSKLKAEFNLAIKQLEDKVVQLAQANELAYELAHDYNSLLSNEVTQSSDQQIDADRLATEALTKVGTCFQNIQKTSTILDSEAILIGLKHGLTAHGAIVCLIFAASLVSTHLFATQLPLVFILACIAVSAYITKWCIDTIREKATDYRAKQEGTEIQNNEALKRFLNNVKGSHTDLRNVEDHLILTQLSTPSRSIWPWLNRIELVRAFSSGLMKGIKSAEFIPFLFDTSDASEQPEHDHNSYFIWLALIACAIIWTFRGLAKSADKFVDPDETIPPPYVYDETIPPPYVYNGEADKLTIPPEDDGDHDNWVRPLSSPLPSSTSSSLWRGNDRNLRALTPDISTRNDGKQPQSRKNGTSIPNRYPYTSSLLKSNSQEAVNKALGSTSNRYTFYTAGTSERSARPASSLGIVNLNINPTASVDV